MPLGISDSAAARLSGLVEVQLSGFVEVLLGLAAVGSVLALVGFAVALVHPGLAGDRASDSAVGGLFPDPVVEQV